MVTGALVWRRIAVFVESSMCRVFFFFFFQAEDGIRDKLVTGVQTCALPIYSAAAPSRRQRDADGAVAAGDRDPRREERDAGRPAAQGSEGACRVSDSRRREFLAHSRDPFEPRAAAPRPRGEALPARRASSVYACSGRE